MVKKSTPKLASKETKSTAEGSNTNAKLNAAWSHEAHIKYRLSDKEYVACGWTKLPQEVVIQKITTYKTFPAKPHMLVFKKRDQPEYRYYPNGTRAAHFKADGSGSIYYPNGKVAIHCYNGIYIVVSPGGKDPLTGYLRAPVITALFDMLGNGVVYDNEGHVVLNFTQRVGVLEGTRNGLPMKWTWPVRINEDESVTVPESQKWFHLEGDAKEQSKPDCKPRKVIVNDEPATPDAEELSQAEETKKGKKKVKVSRPPTHSMASLYETNKPDFNMVDSTREQSKNSLVTSSRAASIEERESGCSLEIDYAKYMKSLKVLKKKNSHSRCAPIKPILRRLNEYISLRILDQANVSLTFNAHRQIFRLELGVVIDPSEIVQVNKVIMKETIAVDGVVNYFEQFPNHSLEPVLNRLTRQRDWSAERMRERLKVAKRCGGFV